MVSCRDMQSWDEFYRMFRHGPSGRWGPALHWLRIGLALLLMAGPVCSQRAAGSPGVGPDGAAVPLEIVLRDRVVAPQVRPFTATIESFGNGAEFGPMGFEPVIYRTMFTAQADAPDRVIAKRGEISAGGLLRSGAFGGEQGAGAKSVGIEVLRVENGHLRVVREGVMAEGGFLMGGSGEDVMRDLAPEAGLSLAPEARHAGLGLGTVPQAQARGALYVQIRAVDAQGRLSPPSVPVAVNVPRGQGRGAQKGGERGVLEAPMVAQPLDLSRPAALPAPRGVSVRLGLDGRARLDWQGVAGAQGYRIYAAGHPPSGPDSAPQGEADQEAVVFATDGPAVQAGDLVILRIKIRDPARARLIAPAAWGDKGTRRFAPVLLGKDLWEGDIDWSLRAYTPKERAEDPAGAHGESYLHLALARGQSVQLGSYSYSGTDQDFYPVLDPARSYRMSFRMRVAPAGAGQNIEAQVLAPGPLAGRMTGLPVRIPPEGPDRDAGTVRDAGWHEYHVDFRPQVRLTGGKIGALVLRISGQGEVDLDDLRIYRSDAPFLALLPEDQARLGASGMAALRTHGFVRTGTRSYDLEALTNGAGSINLRGGNTLPQTLQAIAQAGMDPWLQIEPHLSRAEWLGLAEYLAAPAPSGADRARYPWAAKRVAQGHPAPWTDDFGQLRFELGNETWNTLFRPWVFPELRDSVTGRTLSRGTVYGLYQEHVLSILRESPWWDRLAPKLVPVLGGFNGTDYGVEAARVSPGSAEMTIAEYLGGWDQGEGPIGPGEANLSTVLSFGMQKGLPDAQHSQRQAQGVTEARRWGGNQIEEHQSGPLRTGTYEAGPGYALNGLNGRRVSPEQARAQEIAMKTVAAGTATLDSFLMQAAAGYGVQNYFLFRAGRTWSSHAEWYHGGQAYPAWEWLALMNRLALSDPGGGQMLEVDLRDPPRMDLARMGRRPARPQVPMVGAYAIRSGGRLVIVLVSRLLPQIPQGQNGHIAARISLPQTLLPAPLSPEAAPDSLQVTRYAMSGGYAASNVFGPHATLGTRDVTRDLHREGASMRLDVADLPPGEALVYVLGLKTE
ncbi:hypothetical protein ABEB22_21240 (plasmid) [Thioclava sp. 'Guangxiensis']|uniref:hypothetical protein n=1 Tax=Thioclava sp. 'Guangxiensis' TaxID=3149044 RepID=UPI003877ED86